MDIPIACGLEPVSARQRLDEWRALLSVSVADAVRVAPGRLDLELDGDRADIGALARLAQEEKACCPFFTFSFEVSAEAVTLVIGAPEEAVAVLDDFATLTGPARLGRGGRAAGQHRWGRHG
ncbi:MAG: hypothetical protein ACRDYB_12295 [Acidimicrobiales bacterium]